LSELNIYHLNQSQAFKNENNCLVSLVDIGAGKETMYRVLLESSSCE
jgi:hypothetical protein